MHSNRFIYSVIIALMTIFSTQAFATNKAGEMTNNAIGQSPTISKVTVPAEYYAERVKSLELVRQKNLLAARSLIKSLTRQYFDDGDTWYL